MIRKRLITFLLGAACLVPLAVCSQGNGGCSCRDGNAQTAPNGDAQPQSPSKAADIMYTCPMHPEVSQSSPGKCPKCGMELERRQ